MGAAAFAPIPIVLLTGFLGSGKTALLNRLLRQPAMARTAVIVNEFGEIGIDHLLVAAASDEVVELANGCLCCAQRSDLVATLFGLYAARVNGTVSPFERVVIETTGLADPAPVLLALFTDEAVARRYRVQAVVTVVDAVNGAATLTHHPEAEKQVAAADLLLVSKRDLALPDTVAALERRLTTLNGGAAVRAVDNGDLDAAAILACEAGAPADATALEAWLGAEACHAPHHHHGAGDGVVTFSRTLDAPVPWSRVLRWIEALRMLKGPHLLRIKGLVDVEDRPGRPLVVNAVQEVFHPPLFLDRWPSSDRRTRLVFIVRHGSADRVAATLDALAGDEVREAAGRAG